MKKLFFLFVFSLFVFGQLFAEANKPLIYKINIKQDINDVSFMYLKNGLHQAEVRKANYVLLEMNTYGGAVLEADSMRTAILNSTIPVYVFINNNAASAGALISIACDKIYMRSGASIGAATVVDAVGDKAPDKYQSYMRSLMRSTAESHGQDTVIKEGVGKVVKWRRNPSIAEAMVDERVVIDGLVDSTKILTLTANEAIKYGYCEGIAENIPEIMTRYEGFDDYTIETYNPTLFDHIKGFLMNGVVQAILIMFIIGGIYIELKTPGFGLPSAIAITAAILYFTPLYMDGYAQNWEILIFVMGLILIAFEIFVIHGFGFAGISGIILAVTGLFLSLVGNINFNFESVPSTAIRGSLITVLAGMTLSCVLIIYLASKIGTKGVFYNIALHSDQEGFLSVSEEPKQLIGKQGTAVTMLRPSGKVLIDNEYYDAVANQGYIEKGEKVQVVKYENSQIYVVIM